jgi:hypothetical protein
MVEPQWNPAMEDQAVARVLRIGQTREVTVFRYVTANTIEQVSQRLSPVTSAEEPLTGELEHRRTAEQEESTRPVYL